MSYKKMNPHKFIFLYGLYEKGGSYIMVEVDLGKIFISEQIVEAVNKHRQEVIEACNDKDTLAMLKRANFSMWFGDFMYKFGHRLLQ